MAATKDWGAVLASVDSAATVYFADGHATDYCVHTPPPGAKRATVINFGATQLAVAIPSISGSAAARATEHNLLLDASLSGDGFMGGSYTFPLVGPSGTARSGTSRTFSTYGGDGAAHKMRIVFDSGYGGA